MTEISFRSDTIPMPAIAPDTVAAPADSWYGSLKLALKKAAAVTGIAAVSATAGVVVGDGIRLHKDITAVFSAESADESHIEDALQHSAAGERLGLLWVDCVPDKGFPKKLDGYVATEPITRSHVSVAHIRQSVCRTIINYAGQEDKSQPTEAQAHALDVAVHEADHIGFNSSDEAATECRSFQQVASFAVALGASEENAAVVQYTLLNDYETKPKDYKTPECRDGGPYDLDPAHPGLFPFGQDGVEYVYGK